ncbi:hypothetical protein HK098_000669 [Nowakowskiella sp. JEL0407]|nr:hypothetical protein HK098_000669 [Nowakowskiella sp. JEL0407]
MFGWPTFNPHLNRSVQITIYSSEIVRVLSDIPSNSLGWLLEKSPSLKPSDIKEGVIAYQDLRISGIVPPENVETGNAAYFGWPILICFIVSIILVILYMKRRNKRNRANQAIELRTRAAVPQQKNLPVLSSNDLDQIPCALYDSIRIGTEKEKSPNPDETSSRSFNLVKRTLTALSLSQDSELSCSICIETFKPIDEVRKLPTCEHVFHKECIDNWLLEQSCCCPNCRFDLRIALGIDISDPAMETVIDVVDGAEDVEEEGPSAVVTDRVVDAREDSDPVQVVSDADQRELVPSTWQQINHADTEETAN